MLHRLIRPPFLLVLLLAAAPGCGARKGNVSGLVSYQGAPLPNGKITFICEGGDKPVLPATIRDGQYELKGAPVGPVKITVATYNPTPPVAPPAGIPLMKRPDGEPPPPASNKYVAIPSRYGQPDQSNLSYDVQAGDQVHNIDLPP
ncbi:MAG TPA: hypothetical protein VMS17_23870 [Gemmataceae bacterium]|nr:hypothetical protein [Gemmataceae bacterium]